MSFIPLLNSLKRRFQPYQILNTAKESTYGGDDLSKLKWVLLALLHNSIMIPQTEYMLFIELL